MKKTLVAVFILLSVFIFPSKTFAVRSFSADQSGFLFTILCEKNLCAVTIRNTNSADKYVGISAYALKKDGNRESEPFFTKEDIFLEKKSSANNTATFTIRDLTPNTYYVVRRLNGGLDPVINIRTDIDFDPSTAVYKINPLEFNTFKTNNPYIKGSISVTNPANYENFTDPQNPKVGFTAKLEFSTDPNFISEKTNTVYAQQRDPTIVKQGDNVPGIAGNGTYYYALGYGSIKLNPDTNYYIRETITVPEGMVAPEPRTDRFNTGQEYSAAGTVAAQQEFNLRSYRLLAPLPGISILMNPDLCAEQRAAGRVIPICSVDEFIAYAIRFLIGLTAVILVGKLMWDGYNILTSDVPFLQVKSKSGFYTSLGGLALVLTSYLILNTVNPRLVSPSLNLSAVTLEGEQTPPEGDPGTVIGTYVPIPGLLTAPGIQKRNNKGYVRLPASSNGEYSFWSATPANQQCGSPALVNTIYTVARNWAIKHPEEKLVIGDLNTSGHKSHRLGVDVDIFTPNSTSKMGVGGKFISNQQKAVELGKMFADVGTVKEIYYNDTPVLPPVNQYASTKNADTFSIRGKGSFMFYQNNHYNHFHVRLQDKYKGPISEGCEGI